MQLRYDEDLIEEAVFLCASGRCQGVPSMQIARFHRERERLYGILDPEERNAAFFGLHLEWFREWGLEQRLTDVFREFPLLHEVLAVLAVRKAPQKSDEGAELYVNGNGVRTGVLALRVERLLDGVALRNYLRHELTHLHDMLDPAFGYLPALDLPGLNGVQKRLARERYRLIWDITIDGRLVSAGHVPTAVREEHAAAFARSYSFWPEERQAKTFDRLWRNTRPRHEELIALIGDPRGLLEVHRPAPGGCCPLCDFPTFDWAGTSALPGELRQRIEADFPRWSPEQGLCTRCLESYQVMMQAAPVAVP